MYTLPTQNTLENTEHANSDHGGRVNYLYMMLIGMPIMSVTSVLQEMNSITELGTTYIVHYSTLDTVETAIMYTSMYEWYGTKRLFLIWYD